MTNRNFSPFPVLTTERLTLKQLSVDDQQNIFSLRSDAAINKYLDREPCKTTEDAINFINRVNENIKKNNSLYWAITLTATNTFAGTICLFCFSDENEKCEIGYELLTNFQKQGIMQEAVKKVIDYAFNTIEVKKIEAFFHTDNQESVKLLEKFSFRNLNEPDKTNPELVCYYLKNDIAR